MAQLLFRALYSTIIVTFAMCNSLEDLQKKYADLIIECAKDFTITPADIAQLQNKQLPDKEAIKCLFACAYKKAGMMDEDGRMSVEGTKDIINEYLSDDAEVMKKAIDFTNACSSVNNEAVSDGTKGCERAALMFRCSIEKADEYDIKL